MITFETIKFASNISAIYHEIINKSRVFTFYIFIKGRRKNLQYNKSQYIKYSKLWIMVNDNTEKKILRIVFCVYLYIFSMYFWKLNSTVNICIQVCMFITIHWIIQYMCQYVILIKVCISISGYISLYLNYFFSIIIEFHCISACYIDLISQILF